MGAFYFFDCFIFPNRKGKRRLSVPSAVSHIVSLFRNEKAGTRAAAALFSGRGSSFYLAGMGEKLRKL